MNAVAQAQPPAGSGQVLEVADLRKHFLLDKKAWGQPRRTVYAVDGVSFTVGRGETLALVGESGCGKSTVARSILRLVDVTGGEIRLNGRRIDGLSRTSLRPYRKQMQAIFQDPYSSLNPRMSVSQIIAEPLVNFRMFSSGRALQNRVLELLDMVSLSRSVADRKPHEFSGGQRQRIGIARALAAEPDVIIADEAVSALDVSVQAQIINLLQKLQADLGLAMVFISHDLAVVQHISQRVAVMYLGKIVEIAPRHAIFSAPAHPYTESLLSAVPIPDPRSQRKRIRLEGDVPSPDESAIGLRIPPALPLCVRPMPGGSTGAAAPSRGAAGRLPPRCTSVPARRIRPPRLSGGAHGASAGSRSCRAGRTAVPASMETVQRRRKKAPAYRP